MPLRWKETSFLGKSQEKLEVPIVDVALEESYSKLHRSMGDLRPSRSKTLPKSRNHESRIPYASSMDAIPGQISSSTEIRVTECEEISILEGNQVFPVASYQRGIVVTEADGIRRAESLATFSSAGIARNANSTETSYASGWQKKKVVIKNAGSETSLFSMRAASSSRHVQYHQKEHENVSSSFRERDYQDNGIYENIIDTQYGHRGYSGYSKFPADAYYEFSEQGPTSLYDNVTSSDNNNEDVHSNENCSHENIYENLRKPVIVSGRLKAHADEHVGHHTDLIYENTSPFNATKPRKDHSELGLSEENLRNKDYAKQPTTTTKSTPNLSVSTESDHKFLPETNITNEAKTERKGSKTSKIDPKSNKQNGQVPKTKLTKETNERKPYLETNLDDILWLPTPAEIPEEAIKKESTTPPKKTEEAIEKESTISTKEPEAIKKKYTTPAKKPEEAIMKESTTPAEKSEVAIKKESITTAKKPEEAIKKESTTHDTEELSKVAKTYQKTKPGNASIKRPVCPPPPPPNKTEVMGPIERPNAARNEHADLPASLTPDPADSTLNLAFLNADDRLLPPVSKVDNAREYALHHTPVCQNVDKKDPYLGTITKLLSHKENKERKLDERELKEHTYIMDMGTMHKSLGQYGQQNLGFFLHEEEQTNVETQEQSEKTTHIDKVMITDKIQEKYDADIKRYELESSNTADTEQVEISIDKKQDIDNDIKKQSEENMHTNEEVQCITDNEMLAKKEVTAGAQICQKTVDIIEEEKINNVTTNENLPMSCVEMLLDEALDELTDEEDSDEDDSDSDDHVLDELPNCMIIEENKHDAPPSYAPPPPPPRSESSDTLSCESDLPLAESEGTRSPSPPPRPPSPLMYSETSSTPPLYYSSPLPNLSDLISSPLELLSTEEGDSSFSSNSSLAVRRDSAGSPSPPPIPPRPQNIEELFYHPLPEFDLRMHIYENMQFIHDGDIPEDDYEEPCDDDDIYTDMEARQGYLEATGYEGEPYDSIYENLRNPDIQIESSLGYPGEGDYSNDVIYENVEILKERDIESYTIVMDDETSENENTPNSSSRNISDESTVPGRYFGGHRYAMIDKSRKRNAEKSILKVEFQDIKHDSSSGTHIYDDVDESNIYDNVHDEDLEDDGYYVVNDSQIETDGYYAVNESQIEPDELECYPEHTYATVDYSQINRKKTTVSGSSIDQLYSVVDQPKVSMKPASTTNECNQEEIYENAQSILTHRANIARKADVYPQVEELYENLSAFRRTRETEERPHRPEQDTIRDDESIYCNLTPSLRDTARGEVAMPHFRGRRPKENPPPPPPRYRPLPPSPPSESPPLPPLPAGYLQEENYTSFSQPLSIVSIDSPSGSEIILEKREPFDYETEVQEMLFHQKQRHRRRRQLRQQAPQEESESGSRTMMEFYVNTLTSDSDSDNDGSSASGSTGASTGSRDLEDDDDMEDHIMERTYQVIGGADTVLDTIEEDVEEDSGAESSGHWMFSADNTDTDSVIHIPAVMDLRPHPVESVKEADSTDSDSTLVVEEEEEGKEDEGEGVCGTEVVGGSRQQETGVTGGSSHVEAQANYRQQPLPQSLQYPSSRGSSASEEDDDDEKEPTDSRGFDSVLTGGSSVILRSKKCPSEEEGKKKGGDNHSQGRGEVHRQENMLSRTEAAKLFEKHIDDVFDFESLESCESVYGGLEVGTVYPPHGCASPLAGEEVVFNTSATSQPFADSSGGKQEEDDHMESDVSGEDTVDFSKVHAGGFNSNLIGNSRSKDNEDALRTASHGATPFGVGRENAQLTIGDDNDDILNKTYTVQTDSSAIVQQHATTELHNTPVNHETDLTGDFDTVCNTLNEEPVSMDLFGLPVRWTEEEKKKSTGNLSEKYITNPKIPMAGEKLVDPQIATGVAAYTCKIQKICKTNLEPLCNVDDLHSSVECDTKRLNDDKKVFNHDNGLLQSGERFIESEKENERNCKLGRVTESEHDACDVMRVSDQESKRSEGDCLSQTLTFEGETSLEGETCHYEPATGNLLQSSPECHKERILSAVPNVVSDTGRNSSECHLATAVSDDAEEEEFTRELNDALSMPATHRQYQPQTTISGGQNHLVKTSQMKDIIERGEIIKNDDAICQQHPSSVITGGGGATAGQYPTSLPSGDSDTDTDNTDGDYDEEDHFAAELSLRISTVHSETRSGSTVVEHRQSFRDSDILGALTVNGGKGGTVHRRGDDATGPVSPLACQEEGSSPEMPDSLRSSEGRCGTRSVETLSEDSGLGDRDVRLTPSSPLPAISEGTARSANDSQGLQLPLPSVTARSRRLDIRQARIARARSCGDLRVYSGSSDTDTDEDSDMNGWHSRYRAPLAPKVNGTLPNGGLKSESPFKSNYANYLQQQYSGGDVYNNNNNFNNNSNENNNSSFHHPHTTTSRYPLHPQAPLPSHPHPPTGSGGNEEEVKSRYRRVRESSAGHPRPRRYKSLMEFPWKDDQYNGSHNSANELWYERGPRGTVMGGKALSSTSRGSRRRPQPISVDLAEEFLTQEGLKTPQSKQWNDGTVPILSDDKSLVNSCRGNEASNCMASTNQIPSVEPKTNGTEGGGALPIPQGSWGDEGLAGSKDEVRADVRVQCALPQSSPSSSSTSSSSSSSTVAAASTVPYPHHRHPLDALHHPPSSHIPHPHREEPQHQYSSSSSSPAQLPNECQPEHTGHSGSINTPYDPPPHNDAITNNNNNIIIESLPHQQQREAFDNNTTTHKQLPNDSMTSTSQVAAANMAEVPVRVRTKTYGSHGEVEVYLARADSGRPPPHPAGAPSLPVLTPTGGATDHKTGSRGVTFSPSVKEVNWRESYYEVDPDEEANYGASIPGSMKSSEVKLKGGEDEREERGETEDQVETSPITQHHTDIRPTQVSASASKPNSINTNNNNNKINGSSVQLSAGSSSESECTDEKGGQKVSTPIWHRFKLPKISSPKAPRPKILPKPKNLSPRSSSDTDNSKPASPTPPESSSSTPSSPENKLKKAPSSPKFFAWGSKREKKSREITRPTSAPPPVPSKPVAQVSAGQVVGGGGSAHGGQTGKPDGPESPSVSLTASNREGPSDVSLPLISAETKKSSLISSDKSKDSSGVTQRQSRLHEELLAVTRSARNSHNNSGKEEEEFESNRRSQSVSSSGEDTTDNRGRSPSAPPSASSSPRPAVAKPPLPPQLQRPTQQAFHKVKLLSARRHYFSQERQVGGPERVSPPKDNRHTNAPEGGAAPTKTSPAGAHAHSSPTSPSVPKTVPTLSNSSISKSSLLTKGNFDASANLKERFERFSAATRADRERLARSTPDLSVIRASVRRPNQRIDSCTRVGEQQQEHQQKQAIADSHVAAASSSASASDGEASNPTNAHQGAPPHAQGRPRQAIHERYKNRAQRIYARSRTQSTGVLETDLDTGASREYLTLRETNLDDLYKDLQVLLDTLPSVGGPTPTETKARAKSLLDLEAAGSAMEGQLQAPARPPDTRAKSMEFLLDDGNKASIQSKILLQNGRDAQDILDILPPENELMKGSERQLSEAELRVRRSLQRLDVPEWMKNAQPQQQGFLLRRRDYGSSSIAGGGGGWSAYSSKTASMTSLGSSRAHTPNTPTKVVIPSRVASKGTTGLAGVTSPASNASISPSPSDRSGSLFQYPVSRWSTSRLNSGTTTPTGSVTSTRTTPATYVRQPYLGWRSQSSLASLTGSQSSLTNTGSYLTAADRLALGITSYSQRYIKPSVSAQDKENSPAQANTVVTKSDNEEANEEASTNGSIKLQVPADVADVHSSIKEVTSAIVHYCNESTPSPRASPRGSPRPEGPRAPSPRRLVWVESSFVGSRPITSPETPTSSSHAITPTSQLNGHEEPESNEVPSQPPQPPELVSLVNSLSSACSSIRGESSRDSTAASTNDSTAVIVDSSLGDSSRAGSRHSLSDSAQSTVDRSTVGSRQSTADTVNSGLSSRNIDSLNSRNSVLSSRSSGGCSSRGSVGSSSRSSSSRPGSSRDDIEASPGSGEVDEFTSSRLPTGGVFEDDLTPLSVPVSSLSHVVTPLSQSSCQVESSAPTLYQNPTVEVYRNSSSNAFMHETPTQDSGFRGPSDVSLPSSRAGHRDVYAPSQYDESQSLAISSSSQFDNRENFNNDNFKEKENIEGSFINQFMREEDAIEHSSHDQLTDSTTLEDVLDSLLALPSASRSPSPVSSSHHTLARPFSHPGFSSGQEERQEGTYRSSHYSIEQSQGHAVGHDASSINVLHYGHFRNHDLPTDFKNEGYRKSFSYSSSSGDSSSYTQPQHPQHPPPPPPRHHTTGLTSGVLGGSQQQERHYHHHLHEQRPPSEGSSVSFFLGRDEGEILREPPTCTTHTLSRAHSTTHTQSHVHLDLSGATPTTKRLTKLEMKGPGGTISSQQMTEETHGTHVLLHHSAALTQTPSHYYTNSHSANTAALSHLAHNKASSPQYASMAPSENTHVFVTSTSSVSATQNICVTFPSAEGQISLSENLHKKPAYSQDAPTTYSHLYTSVSTSPSSKYQNQSSIPPTSLVNSVSPTLLSSHQYNSYHKESHGHSTHVSRTAVCVSGTNTFVDSTISTSVYSTYKSQQTNVPSHFVTNSKGSGQVNQLGTSPNKPSSEVVSPISQDPVTDAILAVGVLAAVPSVMEHRQPPSPRVTFHLPPRHMNIPPDSSSENGNGNENVRVEADDESSGANVSVRCRNPGCGHVPETEEDKQTYKMCHNCSTHYCSRMCRRQHWERHKKQCKKIQALAVAKQVTARARDDARVLDRLSTVARRGVRALGRGTVKIFFHDVKGAETFVEGGEVPETHYLTTQNLLPQETGPEVYKQITDMCKHYNTDYKFILYVSICIMNEIPTGSSPKWEREVVSRCAKLRLSGGGRCPDLWSPHPEKHVITRDMDEPETLILMSLPISDSNTSPQTARHIAFSNIQRHLRERGISLKHQYPDVHRKLTAYVEVGEAFPPLTIYPRDANSGSTFMCIIMPETDHAKLQLLGSDASKVRTIDISRPPP